MGDYDKRIAFARRISERREMSSKAASQKFPCFLCTRIKIPCILFLFPFRRKSVASLQKPKARLSFPQQAKEVIDSRPQVMLPAAASSTNGGREQRYSRPRIDDLP